MKHFKATGAVDERGIILDESSCVSYDIVGVGNVAPFLMLEFALFFFKESVALSTVTAVATVQIRVYGQPVPLYLAAFVEVFEGPSLIFSSSPLAPCMSTFNTKASDSHDT